MPECGIFYVFSEYLSFTMLQIRLIFCSPIIVLYISVDSMEDLSCTELGNK